MVSYRVEVFGEFDNTEVHSIVDKQDNYWFLQSDVAKALQIDDSAITHMRNAHPSEFTEFEEYQSIVWKKKKRLVYSEEGFLLCCDLSRSEKAFRLRRWMRKQFSVKQSGNEISIHAKSLPEEDYSDLPETYRMMHQQFVMLAQDRRRIIKLESDQEEIIEEQSMLKERVKDTENRLEKWEDGAKKQPGEMTAIELARHCKWRSRSMAPHNLAVILAATNHGFHHKGFMVDRREQGPNNLPVEVQVFTPVGIATFITEIDSKYSSGEKFSIIPNENAKSAGYKNKRNVFKG